MNEFIKESALPAILCLILVVKSSISEATLDVWRAFFKKGVGDLDS